MNVRNSDPTKDNGVLILACSGAADVGGIADMVARRMARNGSGKMHCLAGSGGKVPAIMSSISLSSRSPAIDGYDRKCAKKTLTRGGHLLSYHLCLADLGMEKGKTPVTTDAIDMAARKTTEVLKS